MPTPNHQTSLPEHGHYPVIWVFHDNKAGHLSQLKGLVDRLQDLTPCKTLWLDCHKPDFTLKGLFFSSSPFKTLPAPDLVIGAGHATHKYILLSSWKYHALSCCIMSPSLPQAWFDTVICPQHDGYTETKKRLCTFGPINQIRPDMLPRSETKKLHLILIGGPSKHFAFDDCSLIQQIKTLCQTQAEQTWLLSTSPRTPRGFLEALHAENLHNLQSYDYQSSELAPLQQLLITSKDVWLSPDSMSMVHEALSAGANVNLFSLKPKKQTRLTRHIETLALQGFVNQDLPKLNPSVPWEADRAAQFLLGKLNQKTFRGK